MKIKTFFDPPPIALRQFDWSAYDVETYGGDENDLIGYGETEDMAVDDLFLRMMWREEQIRRNGNEGNRK